MAYMGEQRESLHNVCLFFFEKNPNENEIAPFTNLFEFHCFESNV